MTVISRTLLDITLLLTAGRSIYYVHNTVYVGTSFYKLFSWMFSFDVIAAPFMNCCCLYFFTYYLDLLVMISNCPKFKCNFIII